MMYIVICAGACEEAKWVCVGAVVASACLAYTHRHSMFCSQVRETDFILLVDQPHFSSDLTCQQILVVRPLMCVS